MNYKNIAYWLTGIVIFSFGILIIIVNEKFVPKEEFSYLILNKIATAVIITGLFTLFNRLILRKNLIDLILGKVHLKKSLDNTGIKEAFTNILDINYRSYFKGAKEIDIVHLYGRTWTNRYEDEIINALNNKCKVRVVLCSSESPYLEGLSYKLDISIEELKIQILEVKKIWEKIQSKIENIKNKQKLSVYYANISPIGAFYRFDNTIVKIQGTSARHKKVKKLNVVICENTKSKIDFYSNCIEDINNLISQSTKFI